MPGKPFVKCRPALACLALLVALRSFWHQPPSVVHPMVLSVIIPTFRHPETLARCLEGFARQALDHTLYSVVVVNDAHDPVALGIVDRFADRMNVVMIQHQTNAGVGAARQTGLLAATGDIIVSYDDDQVPDVAFLLENYRFHMEHTGLEVAMLSSLKWSNETVVNPLLHYATSFRGTMWSFSGLKSGQNLGFGKLWAGCSSFKRTLALKAGGYDTRLRWAEDTDLELRMQAHGLSVRYHPKAFSWATKVPSNYNDIAKRSLGAGNAISTLLLLHRSPETHFKKTVSLLTSGFKMLPRHAFRRQQRRMVHVNRALRQLDCPSGDLCGVDCGIMNCDQGSAISRLGAFYSLLDETVLFNINAGIRHTGLRWRFLTTTPSDWKSYTDKVVQGLSMPEVFDQQWTRLETTGLWPRRSVSQAEVAWAYRCIMLRDPLPQEVWDAQLRFENRQKLCASLIENLHGPAFLVPENGPAGTTAHYKTYTGLSKRRVIKEEYMQLYEMILGRQPSVIDLRNLLPKTKTLTFTAVRLQLLTERALDPAAAMSDDGTWSPRKQFLESLDE